MDYYVFTNSKIFGPYDLARVQAAIAAGKMTRASLVRQGLEGGFVAASEFAELWPEPAVSPPPVPVVNPPPSPVAFSINDSRALPNDPVAELKRSPFETLEIFLALGRAAGYIAIVVGAICLVFGMASERKEGGSTLFIFAGVLIPGGVAIALAADLLRVVLDIERHMRVLIALNVQAARKSNG